MFDDFKFKIGDVVFHKAFSLITGNGMVVMRAWIESSEGIAKYYYIKTADAITLCQEFEIEVVKNPVQL